MYTRYVPGPDGAYRPTTVADAPEKTPPAPLPPQQSAPQAANLKQWLTQLLPKGMETGDLLVLLIALLLLVDGEEDAQTILITTAAFFLL